MNNDIVSRLILFLSSLCLLVACETSKPQDSIRLIEDFNFDWTFSLGDFPKAMDTTFDASNWRQLNLPHDWSIEGAFREDHPAKPEGGALPTGVAWYRKTFKLPVAYQNKRISIEFGGVYRKSDVWINGHHLGQRPNGYFFFFFFFFFFLLLSGVRVGQKKHDTPALVPLLMGALVP